MFDLIGFLFVIVVVTIVILITPLLAPIIYEHGPHWPGRLDFVLYCIIGSWTSMVTGGCVIDAFSPSKSKSSKKN